MYQTEVINEMKNTLQWSNSKLDKTEYQISELDDKTMKLGHSRKQTDKPTNKKYEV